MNLNPGSDPSAIYWTLVQVNQSLPEQEGLTANFFSRDEKENLSRLISPRRKTEWLMGRLAAKALIQNRINVEISLNRISILAESSGSPLPLVDGAALPGVLSISHSGQWACAAYSQSCRFGVDIEALSFAEPATISAYLTGSENAYISTQSEETQNTWRILTWSLKEAFVKAQRLGFIVDPLSVNVTFPQESRLSPLDDWHTAIIASKYDLARCFWRLNDEFVIAFAVLKPQSSLESTRPIFIPTDEARFG